MERVGSLALSAIMFILRWNTLGGSLFDTGMSYAKEYRQLTRASTHGSGSAERSNCASVAS